MLHENEFDRELIGNVHPSDWKNPIPDGRYNLVVIGAGTAGLVAAAGAAGVGAKVALIERGHLGGDCLNVGCVPSKALLSSARAVAEVRDAARLGVRVDGAVSVDFEAVMQRMRRVRARISPIDSVHRFRDELGVDVYLGDARFTGDGRIEVAGQTLQFSRAVIATGASPFVPPIPGLEHSGHLTNESIFDLRERPERLVVLGGGPIGCELTQAFRRFGCQVSMVEMADQFLVREDPDAAQILFDAFSREGVEVHLSTKLIRVEVCDDGTRRAIIEQKGKEDALPFDEMLVAVGRKPNVAGLGLESVGVQFDPQRGVHVDDRLRTTHPNIYAAGDVCMAQKFTHAADFAARAVVRNALFFGRQKLSELTIPWCTYTDPEIAHVGLYERDARAQGIEVDTFVREFSEVDRAIAEDREEGFAKIHVAKGKDRILGATIVGRDAGDMISEVSVAMAAKLGLGAIANVIHPYPTRSDAIRQLGDAYSRTRLTPGVKSAFERFLAWRR
ncbi:MAG: mercuric reductase [Deltaproteobacteria bacterium]|nr:mercuric reductase [Deltaproteobacteria bacterium]MBW2695477.1 mercuric reductase [Deltaproteobacteria bacterium]